jgi:hypothetical protein
MIRRIMHIVLAAGLVTAGGVILGSTAAQASSYSCLYSKAVSLYNQGGVSHVSMTANWQCSDGRFHASGTLYDDLCDHRSARLVLTANGYLLPDQEYYDQWDWGANAGNGCGTYSTFSMSEPAIEIPPDSTQGDLEILVGACSTTCSDYTRSEILITYAPGDGGCATPGLTPLAGVKARTPLPC